MIGNESPFWPENWQDPSLTRTAKPRTTGLTMVIDKGLGLHACEDLLQVAAPYIDVYKLGFGTTVLYPLSYLQQKIDLALSYGVTVMPGGTFFEVARMQAPTESYLARIKALGFNGIEISDGSLPISKEARLRAISLAADAGLKVFSEYGKKSACFTADLELLLQTLREDSEAGADYTIVEARESGNVGVYNQKGEVDTDFLQQVAVHAGEQANRLIWEAPQKEQQIVLMKTLGFQVNLGNIAPADVLACESLRRGLRGDTCVSILLERRKALCE